MNLIELCLISRIFFSNLKKKQLYLQHIMFPTNSILRDDLQNYRSSPNIKSFKPTSPTNLDDSILGIPMRRAVSLNPKTKDHLQQRKNHLQQLQSIDPLLLQKSTTFPNRNNRIDEINRSNRTQQLTSELNQSRIDRDFQ